MDNCDEIKSMEKIHNIVKPKKKYRKRIVLFTSK